MPDQMPLLRLDAYAPAEMAERVAAAAERKAALGWMETLVLSLLAGAFISLGALLFTLVMSEPTLGFGLSRWLGGVAFSLGLVLVLVGGAELFTGNSLLVMAWAGKRISGLALARNWTLVYLGNAIGAIGTLILVWAAGTYELGGGKLHQVAGAIALGKLEQTPIEAVARGILCNVLVCLAVWLSFAARSASDKVLVIVPPIAAFVALGFEHSIANMFLVPAAFLIGAVPVDWPQFIAHLALVTLGNVIGGCLLVAGVYWAVYLRGKK